MVKKISRPTKQSSARKERFPPQLMLKPIQSRTIRFKVANEVVNIPVNRDCLLYLAFATDFSGLVGNTNYSTVKLKRIKMWGLSSDSNALTSCSIEWQSTRGPATLVQDSGNPFEPAHVDTRPPKSSEADFWSQCSSSTTIRNEILFYITAPTGSIVDVTINYVEANGAQIASPSETLVINVVVPNTPSAYLINSLDSRASGSIGTNLIRPEGLQRAHGY